MHRIIAAIIATVLSAGTAFASEQTDVLNTVHQLVDSINKNDFKAAQTKCAAHSFIIDEFPPYLWRGDAACVDWLNDADAFGKKNGITNPKMTLGFGPHIDVVGDRAYVVVPVTFTYRKDGKRTTERGLWTMVLEKHESNWLVAGTAWAKH